MKYLFKKVGAYLIADFIHFVIPLFFSFSFLNFIFTLTTFSANIVVVIVFFADNFNTVPLFAYFIVFFLISFSSYFKHGKNSVLRMSTNERMKLLFEINVILFCVL